MKKKALLIGTIIWALIALGILGVFIMALTGNIKLPFISEGSFSIGFASKTELVKEESFAAGALDMIDISTSHHDIVVNLVDSDVITIRQYDANAENLFTTQNDGKAFIVKLKPRTVIGIMSFNFSPRLEIDLPESYAEAMALSSSSGTIECSSALVYGEIENWGNTKISTNSGSVKLNEGISCGVLDISTGSGSVNLGGVTAAQISIATNSGTQKLAALTSQGSITLKSGSGSISTDDVSASDFTANSNSGDHRHGEISVSGTVTLSSGSGNINCNGIAANELSIDSNSGTLRGDDINVNGAAAISSGSGSHSIGVVSCKSYEIGSGSGTLNYDGLSGYGSVKTGSGSITCKELDIKGDSSISSNSGTIRLDLAEGQDFEINISTSSGSIRAGALDLLYTDQRGEKAFGTVGNGSNGTLDIKTGSGSIHIG